jgi:homoserine dehydrogenase
MGAQALKVALLGCGVVGSEVARQLETHSADLAARVGAPLELVGIAVRDAARIPERAAATGAPVSLFTTDAAALVARGDLDVVIEVMGGIEPTRTLLLSAIKNGASVVSANKALLAEDGSTLHAAATEAGVDLYYEASVAGAIPLLRPMRESLAGDKVHRVLGIVNGTTNYILTRMDETGAAFDDALAEAQALGYAEADPTADVEGFDAAAKAAILATIAFHSRVTIDDVYREGITAVTADTVASARAMGRVIKMLAIADLTTDADGNVGIGVRAHPAMIPRTHPLASVREAFNAVFVETENAGELMFYGRGAGGAPTASAVLGDLVAVARHRVAGSRGPGESTYASLPVRPVGAARTRYHVSLDVADKPGVLAQVAATFTEHGVSIQNVRQEGHGDDAALVIVTHVASDADLASTVEELRTMDTVRAVAGVMRVEGEAGP